MTRSKLLPALAVPLLLMGLTACGSDAGSEPGAGAPATSSEPAASPTTAAEPSPSAPEATATPTPDETTAPTSAAPTGQLINYETGDESGATIATAADTSKLAGAPGDFKTFIAARLAAANPGEGCTEQPQIYVSRVDTGGWARGGYSIPQCGGYAALWAKAGGSWKEVWSGQSLVECTTLTQFRIPARIAGDSCLKGEDTVDYAG